MQDEFLQENEDGVKCSVFRRRIRDQHHVGYRRLTVLFVYGRQRETEDKTLEQDWPGKTDLLN